MVFPWFSHENLHFPMGFPTTGHSGPLGSPNVLSLPLLRPSTLRQRCPRHSRGPQRKMFIGLLGFSHVFHSSFHHVMEILCLKNRTFPTKSEKTHGSSRCFMLFSCSDDQQIRHVIYIFCGDLAILWFVAKSIVKRIETPLHPKFHHKCQLYPPGMS